MELSTRTVLLSSGPADPADDIRAVLEAAGFAVATHVLGSTPAVGFDAVAAAIIEVGERPDIAAAQTRRWRIELGDDIVPVVWVLPESTANAAAAGLDAGADACLARPLDPAVLVAQVHTLARTRAAAARLAAKAGGARLLADQLRHAYAELGRERDTARRVHRAAMPRTLPRFGGVTASVSARPPDRPGGAFYGARRLDEHRLGFFLGDATARGPAAGSLLGVFVTQTVCFKEITGASYRIVPPAEVLAGVNRELLGMGLDDPPLVAMVAGTLDARDGSVTLARAGGPAAVVVPAAGPPESWAVPGPFLGTADTEYHSLRKTLSPGDKLVIGGGAVGGGPDRLPGAAARHRGLAGQAFADAVAADLLPDGPPGDDGTLLVVEMDRA